LIGKKKKGRRVVPAKKAGVPFYALPIENWGADQPSPISRWGGRKKEGGLKTCLLWALIRERKP